MELAYRRWSRAPIQSPKSGSETSVAQFTNNIVLLHGMGGTGSLWRPIAAQLEDDCDVLAPDQRGHGGSRIPANSRGPERPGYSPLDYARDVLETITSLHFHPAWIVGHSMGARTACAVAHLRPEWVAGLVLVDLGLDGLAGGGLGESLARFIHGLPERFPSRAEAREFMQSHSPDTSIAQYLMAVSVALPAEDGGGIGFPFDHAALLQTIDEARGTSIRPWIEAAAQNGIPVLALRGAESRVWSRKEFEAEQDYFADPKWKGRVQLREVAGAGHGLPFEKRSEFITELRNFMKTGR